MHFVSCFEGNLYVNANNKVRPLIIDRDKTPLDSTDGKPYGGCYVNASIELWAQDHATHGIPINGLSLIRNNSFFA